MSHPAEDELVDLAVGEGTAAPDVSAHVDTCEACAATVAELRRTAGLVATAPPYAAWQAPGADVWGRIAEELGNDDLMTEEPQREAPVIADLTPAAPARTPSSHAEPTTPQTGNELERARGGRSSSEDRRRGRRRSIGWGAGLAAASLAIGLLAGRAIWQPETPTQPVAQVALSTLDTKQDEGKAMVVRSGDGLDLTVATSKPLDAGNGYLEVWLLNADGKRMVSVGVLAPGDKASFPISQALIDQGYVIVDISREKFDGSPAHSGDSLLRGKLPA